MTRAAAQADSTEAMVAGDVARALRRNRVPYLFGMPGGGSSIDLIEACRLQQIPFVLVQHETSAAMMGVVCGELTRSCGVCVSIMATGAINLAGGAVYAYLERHPLLCIAETYGAEEAPLMSIQKIDHARTFSSYSKDTIALHQEQPGGQIDAAIELAKLERPGPVFVDYPQTMNSAPGAGTTAAVREAASPPLPVEGDLEGDPEAMAAAIARAEKPLIIAGPVVARQQASDQLLALAEKLQCGVMVTSKARGVVPEDHPLYAGVMSGVYREETLEGRMVGQCDLVLAVGLDRMELLSPWKYRQTLLALDAIRVTDETVGEPDLVAAGPLAQLLEALARSTPARTAWSTEEIRDYWAEAMRDLGAQQAGLTATAVLQRARQMAPRDAILTTEAGIYGRVNLYAWKVYEPGTCFDSSGANTMGFSVPAALAAALVRPQQKVIALVGDGGFLMRAGELETAARLKVAPVIVIFDDGTMGMIRIKQRARGYAREGVDMEQTDFVRLAESFGGVGCMVRSLEEFETAFGRALQSDRLHVIDVRVDADLYASHIKPIRGL